MSTWLRTVGVSIVMILLSQIAFPAASTVRLTTITSSQFCGGPIFFLPNAAILSEEHKACVDEIALQMNHDLRASLVIDGHRDSKERIGISLTRANNARDYLVNEKGVDIARITVRNFSDTCPHESGLPPPTRRVEFWIVPSGGIVSDIDAMKRCASSAVPRIITTETPATSVDQPPVRKRLPKRLPRPSINLL